MKIRRTGTTSSPRYVKMLLCGDPGAGKTLFSSTAPNPLIISAEGGMLSIEDRGVPYVEISTSAEFLSLIKTFQKPDPQRSKDLEQLGLEKGQAVDTLVVDTIDEVCQILAKERYTAAKKDSLTLQDYGWLKEQMKSATTSLRNLEMNVIMTCHLKSRNDDDGRVTVWPAIEGKFSEAIAGYVDLALILRNTLSTEVKGNASKRVLKRYLQTFPDPQHSWVKDRSGKLPQEAPVDFNNDFAELAETIWPGKGASPAGFTAAAVDQEFDEYRNQLLEKAGPTPSVKAGKTAVYEAAGKDKDKAEAAWRTAGLDGLDEVTDEQVAEATELASLSVPA